MTQGRAGDPELGSDEKGGRFRVLYWQEDTLVILYIYYS
jgi:hypothetical protein